MMSAHSTLPYMQAARLALLLTMVLLAPAAAHAASPASTAVTGKAAPALQWADLDGGRATLAQWRGRPVLLNYWASWCGPCLKELPDLQRFSQTQSRARNGVRVVGIALDDAAPAKALRDQFKLSYPQLLESDGPPGSAARFGNRAGTLPFSVLIDAQGRVLRVHDGPLHPADLERWAAAAGATP